MSQLMNNLLSALTNLRTGEGFLDPQEIINKIFPNGWQALVIQLLAFAIMVIIVIVFGYKPIQKLLKKRADYVEKHIKNAEISDSEANRKLKEANEFLLDSKQEAHTIVETAKSEAEASKEVIMQEAKIEIKKAKVQAEKEISQSKIKAQNDIKNEIINVAFSASSHILGREVTKSDNDDLLKTFLEEVE